MRKKFILLLLTLFASSSCNKNNGIKTICPLGAPSILFYTEGNNENFATESVTSKVLAQFQNEEYDAIVIDSTSGLNAVNKYIDKCPYRFAKLLTAGNLYLVTTLEKNKDFNITSNSEVLAFGSENSIPYLTYKALYKEGKVERVDGISNVNARFLNNPEEKDFYLFSEPFLTSCKNKVQSETRTVYSKKLSLKSEDIQIAQAGLFINKNTYSSKKSLFKEYFSNLNTRINNCISNISLIKDTLDKYGDTEKIKNRFGISDTSQLIEIQSNNGLGIFDPKKTYTYIDMNNFLKEIDYKSSKGEVIEYPKDYFIDIDD